MSFLIFQPNVLRNKHLDTKEESQKTYGGPESGVL